MGKGDSKTAKGKRATSSYGNARSHTAPKATGAFAAPAVKKTATKAVPVKKPATKAAPEKRVTTKAAPAKKAATKAAPVKKSAPAAGRTTRSTAATKPPATTSTRAGAASGKSAAKAPATRTKKASVTTSSTAGPRSTTKKAAGTTTNRTSARKLAEQLRVKDDESPWSEDEISEVRGVLLEEIEQHRVELKLAEDELDDLLRASGDGSGDDQADAGAKTAEREHEISVAANARASLRQAEHALEQLEAGTYGICENCGNPIGKLRLQARPRATLCMTCQEKQDRH